MDESAEFTSVVQKEYSLTMDNNVIDDGFIKLKVHMLVKIDQKLVSFRIAQG